MFLPYVRDYVTTYTGKSITTEEWKAHLYGYFEKHGGPEKIQALDSLDWNVSGFVRLILLVRFITMSHRRGSMGRVLNCLSRWNTTLPWQNRRIRWPKGGIAHAIGPLQNWISKKLISNIFHLIRSVSLSILPHASAFGLLACVTSCIFRSPGDPSTPSLYSHITSG